ncbi:MAG TPA: DUF559 domain-containing protein [Actinophytocola sp.]|jgi:hypothetical protein|uniref:endonuclease domain-containing protein n=1 Tax=Actinophytocola sp. TaxID=1872138 RepID=UPI002E02552F|nr:DUF559 domain-containing protein [Actinophytocola sp.]
MTHNPASRTLQHASRTVQQPSRTVRQPSRTLQQLPAGLHGAYLRAELIDAIGLPAVRQLIRTDQLVRYARHVLVDRRRMLEFPTRAAAGLLLAGPKAVLTSHTAALLHGCSAADSGTIHLVAGYERQVHRRADLVVHQGRFDPHDVVERNDLRVLALEVVIADLLCTGPRALALSCADQAMAGLNAELRAEFKAEVDHRIRERPDPRGQCRAAVLLDLASGVPESPAESRLLLELFDAGFPVPEPQFSVCDIAGRERYRLDFAWPEPMIGLEYDGHAAHAERVEADAAREADLRKRGWMIIRASAEDLRNPVRVTAAVRDAFARRGFVARRSDSVA